MSYRTRTLRRKSRLPDPPRESRLIEGHPRYPCPAGFSQSLEHFGHVAFPIIAFAEALTNAGALANLIPEVRGHRGAIRSHLERRSYDEAWMELHDLNATLLECI